MGVMPTHCAGLGVNKETMIAYQVTPDPIGQPPNRLLKLMT